MTISAVIVLFDAFYVINRPATLKNGSLAWLFEPYQIYIQYDTLYGPNNDSFVVIQSWMNLVEAVLLLISVWLSVSSCRIKNIIGAHLAVITSVMVFWKTVVYVFYSADWTTRAVKEFQIEAILYYWLPTSLWIIFPFLVVYSGTHNLIKIAVDRKPVKKD